MVEIKAGCSKRGLDPLLFQRLRSLQFLCVYGKKLKICLLTSTSQYILVENFYLI